MSGDEDGSGAAGRGRGVKLPPIIPPIIPARLPANLPGGLTLRAMVPNAITASALASGLTCIRFAITAASGGVLASHPYAFSNALPLDDWQKSVLFVILAGVLDGVDGRIARLLKAQSRFGAELDSLSDAVSFGVAPALILFLWCLQSAPRLGWFASLAFAICCVLRLARFNAALDMADQPHKSAGFLTGVPAPLGAALAFLPMYLWIASGNEIFRMPQVVGPWLLVIAFLMISGMATLSWQSARPRRAVRLELLVVLALVFAALISEPWLTLAGICLAYLLLLPVGVVAYGRVRRRRAARADLRQKARAAAGPAPDEP